MRLAFLRRKPAGTHITHMPTYSGSLRNFSFRLKKQPDNFFFFFKFKQVMMLSYCTKYQGTNFKIHEPYTSLLLRKIRERTFFFYPGELGWSESRLNLIFQTQISIPSTPELQDRLCLAYASCPKRAKRCRSLRVLARSREAAVPATCLREGETERNPRSCGALAR